jgi:hypothetical protein
MNSQQIGLLAVQLISSVAVLGWLGAGLVRHRETKQKYSLFAVRDKFLYLAAAGILPQGSMVFNVFYSAMNTYIAELETVTIVSFIRASIKVKNDLQRENQERLLDSLKRSAPEVQETVHQFIKVVMDAMRYNSPLLNLVLIFASHCARLFSLLRKHRNFDAPVYDTYRYYESMNGRMGLA